MRGASARFGDRNPQGVRAPSDRRGSRPGGAEIPGARLGGNLPVAWPPPPAARRGASWGQGKSHYLWLPARVQHRGLLCEGRRPVHQSGSVRPVDPAALRGRQAARLSLERKCRSSQRQSRSWFTIQSIRTSASLGARAGPVRRSCRDLRGCGDFQPVCPQERAPRECRKRGFSDQDVCARFRCSQVPLCGNLRDFCRVSHH